MNATAIAALTALLASQLEEDVQAMTDAQLVKWIARLEHLQRVAAAALAALEAEREGRTKP